MKRKVLAASIIALLSLTGCSQRVADLTVASTKNFNLNSGQLIKGQRVNGEDTKAIILFPVGIPSVKEAADKAIEKDNCAVGLTDVAVDQEFFAFIFGYAKIKVEGDLIIDKSRPGCEKS